MTLTGTITAFAATPCVHEKSGYWIEIEKTTASFAALTFRDLTGCPKSTKIDR
jgi:hypothetical protein